jgi:hypothetical protein
LGSAAVQEAPNRAIDDLRYYLRCWRRWVKSWKPALGFPSQWILAKIPVKAPVGCGNVDDALEEPYRYEDEIEDSILRAIDSEVDNLTNLKRAAVRLIYLREEPGKAVFRSGRFSIEEAYVLCNQAELEMIPKLRAKGVVLGGI